jgi:ammonium transporter
MRTCWWLAASLLFAGCLVLPTNWATSQEPATKKTTGATEQEPKSSEEEIAALQKALKAAQKDLTAAKKAIDELKEHSGDIKEVSKKAAAAEKAATETAKALETAKTELAATKTALTTLSAEVAKSGGGDLKATAEKVAGLEKGTEATTKAIADANTAAANAATTAKERGDSAWMLASSALVLFMVPGLALFYGGMVRRKNVLATMMQSMAALAVVGVYWIAIGYGLAFGPSALSTVDGFLMKESGGLVGWSWDLFFLKGIKFDDKLPNNDIPVYLHVMFQGMFAIITPALISGAIAERIRFWPFCIFMVLWVTFVYCPLAHMVWAFDWFDMKVVAADRGKAAIGFLGKMGAEDFAGGTVVHIAAGMAGLACCLILGKRAGYPKMVAHPNSMVLTLLGAGLLWFGWFGFNGGSATNSSPLATSAFAATQAAAAAAGLAWMVIEWLHKGKPTALGLASGIVAGLVAVTPASGYVYMYGGICIGIAAALICYLAVALKSKLGYDDSLDAFGVHGVGGFVGAVLTGVFCSSAINGADGMFSYNYHRARFKDLDTKLVAEAKTKSEEAAAELKKQETEENIEGLTKAVEAAEKKVADASAEAKPAAEKELTEAKDKLKEATEKIKGTKATAVDTASTLENLEKEKKALEEKIAAQDDKEHEGKDKKSSTTQVYIQLKAACFSVVFAFALSMLLCLLTHLITGGNFKTDEKGEADGLDRTEHGEVGFDFSGATESVAVSSPTPRHADVPPGNGTARFDLQVSGADHAELMKVWTGLCQPKDDKPDADFLALYPYVTTIRGTTFRCRGGDAGVIAKQIGSLFTRHLGKEVKAVKA